MIKYLKKIDDFLDTPRKLTSCILSPALDLSIRIYMAQIFFVSGQLKLNNYLNDDWGSTLFLFQEIHPVPGISAEYAAIGATAGELILPILLVLGLFGRFAAAGLIVMTMVIQFAVPADYGLRSDHHYLWMMLLAVPLINGPGLISLDALIRKFLNKSNA